MNTRNIVYSSSLIAFGILLPFIFHYSFPASWGLGMMFSPIHYSAFFAGGFFGPLVGGVVGIITPLLSNVITAMPQYPFSVFIAIETAVYGIVFGLLYYKFKMNIYVSLIISMIIGRLANLGAIYFLGYILIGTPKMFSLVVYLTDLLPGLVGAGVQLLIIPIVIRRVFFALPFKSQQ